MSTKSLASPAVQQKLLRVEEAAERLGVKPSTIRKHILLRRVGAVCLSARCVRIPEGDIERLISAGYVPARNRD